MKKWKEGTLLAVASALLACGAQPEESELTVTETAPPVTVNANADLRSAAEGYLTALKTGDIAAMASYYRGDGCEGRAAAVEANITPDVVQTTFRDATVEVAAADGPNGYTRFGSVIGTNDENLWSRVGNEWVLNC